jgi:hypothetical protein
MWCCANRPNTWMHPTGAHRCTKPLALRGPSTHGLTAISLHSYAGAGAVDSIRSVTKNEHRRCLENSVLFSPLLSRPCGKHFDQLLIALFDSDIVVPTKILIRKMILKKFDEIWIYFANNKIKFTEQFEEIDQKRS